MNERSQALLLKLANTTLVLVYLVIFAGAVVRATGSGMGCPDWPKCFGRLIPPTDTLSLRKDYRKIYVEKRKAKNERMAGVLRFFGANDLAEKLLHDPSIYNELDFNVSKAWIEYANRLLGVLLGMAQLALVVAAWRFRKNNFSILYFSLGALALTIFEGWLGSIVVSTNLLSGTITLHMLLALGIMVLMTAIIVRIENTIVKKSEALNVLTKNILRLAIILSLAQVMVGTRVREQVDNISVRFDNRAEWIAQLDHWFDSHRLIALAVLVLNALLFYRLRNLPIEIKRFANYLLGIIFLEIAAGITLSYFSLPAFVQPIHLLFAVLMFGLQVSLLFRIKRPVLI